MTRTNWTGDRAIGFVVGVVGTILFSPGLMTMNPWPCFAALAVLAVGIFAPALSKGA